MLKLAYPKPGLLKKSALFLGTVIFTIVCMQSTQAGTGVPLPLRKPVNEQRENFNPLQYASSLLDFSEAEVKGGLVPKLLKKAAAQKPNSAPLSKADAALYKTVFEAQKQGDIKKADAALKQISDLRLMGHILSQRYLHPNAYRSSFDELQKWLVHYNDLPDAERIYRLAQNRKPAGFKGELPKPVKSAPMGRVAEPTMQVGKDYVSKRQRSEGERANVQNLGKRIIAMAKNDQPGEAMKQLDASAKIFDEVEYDIIRGEIASSLLYNGDTKGAYALASKALQRSGTYVPKAAWVAGLIAWKASNYGVAAKNFEIAAQSKYASSWMLASGAYWTARANMRLGNVKTVSKWLSVGMDAPRTFYGLLSTRALGRDFDFDWKTPTFTAANRDILAKIPAGNRAIALVEAGQMDLAQNELIRVSPASQEERDALLAYAGYANLPGLGMRMASALASPENNYDGALYPFGPWQPPGGFTLDPALLHAIMRQESRFDPEAESPSGARGLMQLMPSTAKRVAGGKELVLEDPEINLEIGQRYLERLMKEPTVKGDLFYLLIAYNAGPGNLAKWKKRWPDVKDPLLFIELIPSAETRAYVEYVLANYWIYRMKEDKPVPSLDAIAQGQTPKYAQAEL
jgi:soluble lytic murein transglycosylase